MSLNIFRTWAELCVDRVESKQSKVRRAHPKGEGAVSNICFGSTLFTESLRNGQKNK
jgi:hypothetical protein